MKRLIDYEKVNRHRAIYKNLQYHVCQLTLKNFYINVVVREVVRGVVELLLLLPESGVESESSCVAADVVKKNDRIA